jgi:hypothetical protein
MQGRADERLRPPVQLADPVPSLEVWGASAVLELPVLRLDTQAPRDLTDGGAAPFAIGPEEFWERRLERAVHNPSCPGRTLDVRAGLVSARRERRETVPSPVRPPGLPSRPRLPPAGIWPSDFVGRDALGLHDGESQQLREIVRVLPVSRLDPRCAL